MRRDVTCYVRPTADANQIVALDDISARARAARPGGQHRQGISPSLRAPAACAPGACRPATAAEMGSHVGAGCCRGQRGAALLEAHWCGLLARSRQLLPVCFFVRRGAKRSRCSSTGSKYTPINLIACLNDDMAMRRRVS